MALIRRRRAASISWEMIAAAQAHVNRADRFAAGRPSDPAAVVVSAMVEAFEQARRSDRRERGEWTQLRRQLLHLRIAGDGAPRDDGGASADLRAGRRPGPDRVPLGRRGDWYSAPGRDLSEAFSHTALWARWSPGCEMIGVINEDSRTRRRRRRSQAPTGASSDGWTPTTARPSTVEPLQLLPSAWQWTRALARSTRPSPRGTWRPLRGRGAWGDHDALARLASRSATTMWFSGLGLSQLAGSATTGPAASDGRQRLPASSVRRAWNGGRGQRRAGLGHRGRALPESVDVAIVRLCDVGPCETGGSLGYMERPLPGRRRATCSSRRAGRARAGSRRQPRAVSL